MSDGEYILLMHGDNLTEPPSEMWDKYFAYLSQKNVFAGGSAIGVGACFRKSGLPSSISEHLTGFVRIRAASLADAAEYLDGNPVYESGGTIEIRELPRD